MNDQTTKPTSVRIDDAETLELCSQLRDLRRDGRKMTEELQARYQAEADDMNAAFERKNNELWAKLYERTGVDPDGEWTVDTEYMDAHGVAFVKHDEQRHQCGMPDGLAQLLGGVLLDRQATDVAEVEEPTLN